MNTSGKGRPPKSIPYASMPWQYWAVSIAVIAVAVVLVVFHAWKPHLGIDYVSAALLGIALLPVVLPYVQKLSGAGVGVETRSIDKVFEEADEALENAEEAQPQTSEGKATAAKIEQLRERTRIIPQELQLFEQVANELRRHGAQITYSETSELVGSFADIGGRRIAFDTALDPKAAAGTATYQQDLIDKGYAQEGAVIYTGGAVIPTPSGKVRVFSPDGFAEWLFQAAEHVPKTSVDEASPSTVERADESQDD